VLKRINYFDNREDCINFLKQFNFEHYVPRLSEHTKGNQYCVELTDDLKDVYYCQVEHVQDGIVWWKCPFYDMNRQGDFLLAKTGERLYQEHLEAKKYFKEYEKRCEEIYCK